jgi:hypothetical protein
MCLLQDLVILLEVVYVLPIKIVLNYSCQAIFKINLNINMIISIPYRVVWILENAVIV